MTDSYFIKIVDSVNKSETIVNKVTSFETYLEDYVQICNQINKLNDFSVVFCLSDAVATISKPYEILNKGYLYNTKTKSSEIVYELSLVKVDTKFSSYTTSTESTQTTETTEILQNKVEASDYWSNVVKTSTDLISFLPDTQMNTHTNTNIQTQTQYDLINELKMKLTLPNIGLKTNPT